MNKLKVLALSVAVLALLSSCGTKQKTLKSAGDERDKMMLPPRELQEQKERKLYPSGIEYDKDMPKEAVELKPKSETRAELGALSGVQFGDRESANIRVGGINPLPQGGVLKVDLDEIRELFCFPYEGEFLSDYGMRGRAMHTGVDIRVVPNDTIRSVLPGVVRMSKSYGSYGNIVVIQHPQGFETLYAHCSRNLVAVNDVVNAGDQIALGGRTGRATTEHLHFEVRVAGEHVDPKRLIDVRNHRLNEGMMYVSSIDDKMLAYNTPSEGRKIADNLQAEEQERIRSQESAAAKRAELAAEAEKEAARKQYYNVQKGDTLYGIALRNKTTVRRLCELNNISESSILQINQQLRVK